MGMRILLFADVVKHLSVGGMLAGYENDPVMGLAESFHFLPAVGYLAADRIPYFYFYSLIFQVIHYLVKFVQAHGGLAEQGKLLRDVFLPKFFQRLENHGLITGLSVQSDHLGMIVFTENEYIFTVLVSFPDVLLEF